MRGIRIKPHPWAQPYEGVVAEEEEEEGPNKVFVDPQVEVPREKWAPRSPQEPPDGLEAIFVDGVRRIDVGVAEDDGGTLYWGMFGSYGVGAVVCRQGQAQVIEEVVERCLIMGGDRIPQQLDIPCGSGLLRYEGVSLSSNQPPEIRGHLQKLMLQREGSLVSRLGKEEGGLIVIDGPLTSRVAKGVPVIGYVKTHHRSYLDEELFKVALRLSLGTRTPLFQIQGADPGDKDGVDRLSCYVRVSEPVPGHHAIGGIVRLEMWQVVGREVAARLADWATTILPRLASASHWDVRAPVNLYPVAALERELRHRLGDHYWVRRAILQFLQRG